MLVLLKTAFYVAGWLGYGGEWVWQTGFLLFPIVSARSSTLLAEFHPITPF